MTDIAGPTPLRAARKRRIPLIDTVAVRSLVWLALASALVAPIAVTHMGASETAHHPPVSTAPPAQIASPTPMPPLASPMPASPPPSPTISASVAPSAIAPTRPAGAPNLSQVRERLAAVLSAYQNRDDFGTPESAAQAASALHWCAEQLAVHEHISAPEASSTLSAALIQPRSPEGLRVVSAIEAPAQGADDTSRMHCASLLYAQLEH